MNYNFNDNERVKKLNAKGIDIIKKLCDEGNDVETIKKLIESDYLDIYDDFIDIDKFELEIDNSDSESKNKK